MPGRYVALGDSFSAGEGVPPFVPGTDVTLGDACHRSTRAYSQLLAARFYGKPMPRDDFVACSGAVMNDVYLPNHDNRGEPPQIARLHRAHGPVGLVTMTMGGNNVGFADVIQACLLRLRNQVGILRFLEPGVAALGSGACRDSQEAGLRRNLDAVDGTKHADSRGTLEHTYEDVRRAAGSAARILVGGYPHEFDKNHRGDCSHIDAADLAWANGVSDRLDAVIKRNIDAANAHGARVEYVDVTGSANLFDAHGLCGPQPAFNDFAARALGHNKEYSFHPNALGQQLYEQSFLRVLGARSPPSPSPPSTSSVPTAPRPKPAATPAPSHTCPGVPCSATSPDGNFRVSIEKVTSFRDPRFADPTRNTGGTDVKLRLENISHTIFPVDTTQDFTLVSSTGDTSISRNDLSDEHADCPSPSDRTTAEFLPGAHFEGDLCFNSQQGTPGVVLEINLGTGFYVRLK